MKNNTQSRRNFLKTAGKAGLAALLAPSIPAIMTGCHDDKSNSKSNSKSDPCASKFLELYENLNDHFGTLTKKEQPQLLKSTSLGSTTAKQSIRPSGMVTFDENEFDVVGDFLYVDDGSQLLNYKLAFTNGLTSARNGVQLPNLLNLQMNILGQDYKITNAALQNDGLMTLQFDSTDGLTQIILADKLGDGTATGVPGVTVNGKLIEDATVEFKGSYNGAQARLDSIDYNLQADAILGDLYVAKGEGVRQHLDEPEGLLSPNWDMKYDGLTQPLESLIQFTPFPSGYALEFTNKEGILFNTPLLENTGGVLEYSNAGNKFHFVEGNDVQTGDRFVTNRPGTDFTHILRYDSLDIPNRQVSLTDFGTGFREITYDATTKVAELVVGGITHKVQVDEAAGTIQVDLDGDGNIGSNQVYINDLYDAQLHFKDNTPAVTRDMQIRTLADKLDSCLKTDENIDVQFSAPNPTDADVSIPLQPGLKMVLDNPINLERGMTRYGVTLERQELAPRSLIVKYPQTQREAKVNFTP